MLTLNVWFGAREQLRRARAVTELLESLAPSVVALQEVTNPFLEVLAASRALGERYWISEPSFEGHGAVLLSSLPPVETWLAQLGGATGRTMPWAVVEAFGARIAVGGVHLESGRHNAPVRAEQLAECFARLSPYEHALLVGDTNFADGEPVEEAVLTIDWVDGWRSTHPATDPGYTRDTGANPMAASLRNGDLVQRRIDRVLVRSTRFRPRRSELVCTAPIADGIWPSDHFGLLVELAG